MQSQRGHHAFCPRPSVLCVAQLPAALDKACRLMERQAAGSLPALCRPFAARTARLAPSGFLREYSEVSPEGTELFAALARLPAGNTSKASVGVLRVLRLAVLLLPMGQGLRIVRRLLRSHVTFMLAALNGSSPRLMRATLALLGAVAGHSVPAARALAARVSLGYRAFPVLALLRASQPHASSVVATAKTSAHSAGDDDADDEAAAAAKGSKGGAGPSRQEMTRRLTRLRKRIRSLLARMRGGRSRGPSHDADAARRERRARQRSGDWAAVDAATRPADGMGLGGGSAGDDVRSWWVRLVAALLLCPVADVRRRAARAPLILRLLVRGLPLDDPDVAALAASALAQAACTSPGPPLPARALATSFDRPCLASVLRLYAAGDASIAILPASDAAALLGDAAAAALPLAPASKRERRAAKSSTPAAAAGQAARLLVDRKSVV